MRVMPRARRRAAAAGRAAVAALLLCAASAPARAAELTAFVSGATPGASWGTGFGGALTITLFNVVGAEVEGARQAGELPSTSLWTLSGKAYLGPSFGRLVPYVGIGAGVYLESLPVSDDRGTLGLVFVGAKLKFPFGLIIRGEYQWTSLPMAAPVVMDHRYFVGLGLGF
jgi:hypothetical protein